MRFVFLLVLLIGAAVGFGYPWAITRLAGHEIGTWRVQDAVGGFRPVETALASSDAPVNMVLDVTGITLDAVGVGGSLVTLTVATDDRTVFAMPVDAAGAKKREDSPQTAQPVYRLEAGTLTDIQDGNYRFTLGLGDGAPALFQTVDLHLFGGFGAYDPRAQPIGLCIMAVGFIGLAISLGRRRGAAGTAPEDAVKKRWGRGPTVR